MELWKKFVEDNSSFQEILEKYLELRILFQEKGYTNKSIERVSSGPARIFEIRAEIGMLSDNLQKQLRNYGFDVSREEFILYLQPKLNKIDSLTPLKDGNNERNNSGNEDY
jgi:hypothetical protein